MIRQDLVLCSACCALALLLLPMAVVQAAPIVQYSFPLSWDGMGAAPQVVTDLSPAGNNGMTSGGAALSANVPPGAPGGSMSINGSGEGGVLTDNVDLLENPTLEAAGGFEFSTSFFWDGNDGNRAVQKIIDNEGTESLQLANIDSVNNTADLVFNINDSGGPTISIVANTWYDARAIFDTRGNSIDGGGNLDGLATLFANGASTSQALTRTSGGGSSSNDFNRPISVGVLALPAAPTLVNFSGDIYNPTVSILAGPNGDFNNDNAWDCADINALTAAIAAGSTDLSFDMNQDGTVDVDDVTDANIGWLAVGGANNVPATGGNAFLVGDASLDGVVDGLDFIEWNAHKFTSLDQWCGGDFNADGIVDGLDFIEWNANKFTSSDGVSAVPEPSLGVIFMTAVIGLARFRRR